MPLPPDKRFDLKTAAGVPDSTGGGPGAAPATGRDPQAYVPYTDFNGATLGLFPAPSFEDEPLPGHHRASLHIVPEKPHTASWPASAPDLGVHLHLHFLELLREMTHWLGHIPYPFKLYVSVTDAPSVERVEDHLSSRLTRAAVDVRPVENRGRDLAPFVTEFAEDLAGHEFIAHFHTKRSAHSAPKSDWRRQLLANLMGSPDTVRFVFERFAADPRLGMVFPVYHRSLRQQISWGNNFLACEKLARRLNLSIEMERLALFPAGSMFWARSSALAALLQAHLELGIFPQETGQLDGTTAHALERLFGELVVARGGHLLQIRNERAYTDRRFDPPGRWRLSRWFRPAGDARE